MENPDCNTCARKKHCFVKEFQVLSCEDYRPEDIDVEEVNTDDPKLTK